MNKNTLYEILISSTPEDLNKFISEKGQRKIINAIEIVDKEVYDKRFSLFYPNIDKK